jgi:hypothetical protein
MVVAGGQGRGETDGSSPLQQVRPVHQRKRRARGRETARRLASMHSVCSSCSTYHAPSYYHPFVTRNRQITWHRIPRSPRPPARRLHNGASRREPHEPRNGVVVRGGCVWHPGLTPAGRERQRAAPRRCSCYAAVVLTSKAAACCRIVVDSSPLASLASSSFTPSRTIPCNRRHPGGVMGAVKKGSKASVSDQHGQGQSRRRSAC